MNNEEFTFSFGYGVIAFALLVFLIVGIFLVVKGIIYYKNAVEVHGKAVPKGSAEEFQGSSQRHIKTAVEFEYDGEVIKAETEENFTFKREQGIEPGEELTVWYSKQFRKCTTDRKGIIAGGVSIIVSVLLLCLLFIGFISGIITPADLAG